MEKINNANITELQLSALQKAYRYFNSVLFFNSLNECFFTFSSSYKVAGFFIRKMWMHKENTNKKFHEISLSKNILRYEPIVVFSTLVHEMVHLWQFEQGRPSKNNYHNKEWAWKMRDVGLIPSHTGKAEGKETGEKMSHYIESGGRFEIAFEKMPKEFLLPLTTYESKELLPPVKGNKETNEEKETLIKRRKKKQKYFCANCNAKVWGKPNLKIICGICEIPFTMEED